MRAPALTYGDSLYRLGLAQVATSAGVSENSLHHWRSVAGTLATRAMGNVAGYERANIAHIKIKAVLDDRTTNVCRHLHGRVIPVPTLRAQADAWMDASSRGNRVDATQAWPFFGDTVDLSQVPTSELNGVGLPPYHHGNCRTITVAYFGDAKGDLGKWRRTLQDRDRLPKADVEKIVERAKGAVWAEGKSGQVARGHFLKHGDMLGLTSLTQYNDSISDTIRRAGREVWLYQRKGNIRALFARPHQLTNSKGEVVDGFIVTAVDLEQNKIVTHHFKAEIQNKTDEIAPVLQGGKGIMKGIWQWLTKK